MNLHYETVGDDGVARWEKTPVPDDRYVVIDRLPGRQKPRVSGKGRFESTKRVPVPCDRVILVRTGTQSNEIWHALTFRGNPFRINGRIVREGIVQLEDRCELRIEPNGPRWFLSMERRARLEVLTSARAGTCPRCSLPLERGQTVAICGICNTMHHQDVEADLGCWLHGDLGCAGCRAPASLDEDDEWSPRDL